VIGAVEQRHLGVHHREADEHALIPHILRARSNLRIVGQKTGHVLVRTQLAFGMLEAK